MKKFATSYFVSGQAYSSHVWAKDFEHANELCKERCLREFVLGQIFQEDKELPMLTPVQELHEAVFLSWILLNMKVVSPEEILGDKGIVHLMVHSLSHMETEGANHSYNLDWLRRLVPGYRKPDKL